MKTEYNKQCEKQINAMNITEWEQIEKKICSLAGVNTAEARVSDLVFDKGFRKLCEDNACGNFGKNYTCPPLCGKIDDMMAQVQAYDRILVYQNIFPLEDSYDYEGMMEGKEKHSEVSEEITDFILKKKYDNVMHLGAGGCTLCEVCGAQRGVPCIFPKRALVSLEACGIAVSNLAQSAGMKYINGENTVTFFGAVFFR